MRNQQLEGIATETRVSVGAENKIVLCMLERKIQSAPLASVVFSQHRNRARFSRELVSLLKRFIRRAIIDNDDFVVGVFEFHQRTKSGLDVLGFLVCWYKDRDAGPGRTIIGRRGTFRELGTPQEIGQCTIVVTLRSRTQRTDPRRTVGIGLGLETHGR